MTQGVIPFKDEEEKTQTGMTTLAELPVSLDQATVIGLSQSIKKHLNVREYPQSWSTSQMISFLVIFNLVVGDSVDDLNIFEPDKGFCGILLKSESHGLKRKAKNVFFLYHRQDSYIYPIFMIVSRKKIGNLSVI